MFPERRNMVLVRVGNEHFKPSLLPATHPPTQTELLSRRLESGRLNWLPFGNYIIIQCFKVVGGMCEK